MKHRNPPDSQVISVESYQRTLIYAMCPLVVLWVKLNSVDSTIVKGPLLIFLSSLLLASFISGSFLRGSFQWHRSGMELIMLLFLFTGSLCTVLSWAPFCSPRALEAFLSNGILFFAGTQLFREFSAVRRFVQTIIVLSLLVSIIALAQLYFEESLGIKFDLGPARRPPSTLGNASYLGGFLALTIPLTLSQAIDSSSGNRRLGIAALLFTVPVLLLTQSRSSIVAVVLATILLVGMLRISRTLVITSIVLFFLTAGIVVASFVPGLTERITNLLSFTDSISFSRRVVFWEAGLKSVMNSPLVGYGLGSHERIIPQFRAPDYWVNGSEDVVPHAHNEFLEVAIESGIPGLLLFAAICGMMLWNGVLAVRSGNNGKKSTAAGILCSLVAILVDNLVNVSLRQHPVALIMWILAGIIVSDQFVQSRVQLISFALPRNRIAALLPLLVWGAIMIFIGGDALARIESDSNYLQGRLAASGGRKTVAVDEYKRAVEANPCNLVARLDLSLALLRSDRFDEALSTIRGLKQLVPHYPKASLVEAASLWKLQKLKEASNVIQEELSVRDHPEVYFLQSIILQEMKDTVGARTALEKIITQNMRSRSQIYLSEACTSLLALANSDEDFRRLSGLLHELVEMFPTNQTVTSILNEVNRRTEKR